MADRLVRYIVTDPNEEDTANIIMDTKAMLQRKANDMIRHEQEYRKVLLMRDLMRDLATHLTNALYLETVKHETSIPPEQTILVHLVNEFYQLAKQNELLLHQSPQLDIVASLVTALFEAERKNQLKSEEYYDIISQLTVAYYHLQVEQEKSHIGESTDIINALVVHAYDAERKLQAQDGIGADLVAELVIQLFIVSKRLEMANPDLSDVVAELTMALYKSYQQTPEHNNMDLVAHLCTALFQVHLELNNLKSSSIPPDVVTTLVNALYTELKRTPENDYAHVISELAFSLYHGEIEKHKEMAGIMSLVGDMVVALYHAEKQLMNQSDYSNDIVVTLVVELFNQLKSIQSLREIMAVINALHDEFWGTNPQTLKIMIVDEKEVIDQYVTDVYTNKKQFPRPTGLPESPQNLFGTPTHTSLGIAGNEIDSMLHNVTQMIQKEISKAQAKLGGSSPPEKDMAGPPLLSQLETLKGDLEREKLKGTQSDLKIVQDLRTRYDKLKFEQQKLRGELLDLQEQASEIGNAQILQQTNSSLEDQIKSEEGRISEQKMRLQQLKGLIKGIDPKNEIKNLQRSISTKQTRLNDLEKQKNRIETDIEKENDKQASLEDLQSKQEELAIIQSKIDEINNPTNPQGIPALRAVLNAQRAERSKDTIPISVVTQQISHKTTEWKNLEKKLISLESDIKKEVEEKENLEETKRKKAELEKLQGDVAQVENQIQDRKKTLTELEDENRKNKGRIDAEKIEIEMRAKELKKEYERKTKENVGLMMDIEKARKENAPQLVRTESGEMVRIPTRTELEIKAYEKEIEKLDRETLGLQEQLGNARIAAIGSISGSSLTSSMKAQKLASEQRLKDARKLNQDVKTEFEKLRLSKGKTEKETAEQIETLRTQERSDVEKAEQLEKETANVKESLEVLKLAVEKAKTELENRKSSFVVWKDTLNSRIVELKKKKTEKLRELHNFKLEHSKLFELLGISVDNEVTLSSPFSPEVLDIIADYVTEQTSEYRTELGIEEKMAERNQLQDDIRQLSSEIASMTNILSTLPTARAKLKAEEEQLQSDLKVFKQKRDTLKKNYQRLNSKIRSVPPKLESESLFGNEPSFLEEEERYHRWLEEEEELDIQGLMESRTIPPLEEGPEIEENLPRRVGGQEAEEEAIQSLISLGEMGKARLFGFSKTDGNPIEIDFDITSQEDVQKTGQKLARIVYMFQKGFPLVDQFINTVIDIVARLNSMWDDVGFSVEDIRNKWAADTDTPEAERDFARNIQELMIYFRNVLFVRDFDFVNRFLEDISRMVNNDPGIMTQLVNFLIGRHVIYPGGLAKKFLAFYDQTLFKQFTDPSMRDVGENLEDVLNRQDAQIRDLLAEYEEGSNFVQEFDRYGDEFVQNFQPPENPVDYSLLPIPEESQPDELQTFLQARAQAQEIYDQYVAEQTKILQQNIQQAWLNQTNLFAEAVRDIQTRVRDDFMKLLRAYPNRRLDVSAAIASQIELVSVYHRGEFEEQVNRLYAQFDKNVKAFDNQLNQWLGLPNPWKIEPEPIQGEQI